MASYLATSCLDRTADTSGHSSGSSSSGVPPVYVGGASQSSLNLAKENYPTVEVGVRNALQAVVSARAATELSRLDDPQYASE
ncbi:MAG: hypothetical protein ABL971_12580 [Vicinamibacterales bacterium]